MAVSDARRTWQKSRQLDAIALALAGCVALTGCGRIHYDPLARDAQNDVLDASIDVSDSAIDAGPDASIDTPLDTAADAFDVRPDIARDVAVDATDVAADVRDGSVCMVAASPDFCLTLPALPVAPVIDGIPECGIGLHDLTPVGWTGVGPIPAGNSARAGAAWRPDGLYVVVVVTDPTRSPPAASDPSYCGDGVEIYFDPDGTFTAAPSYDDPGTSQIIITAPADNTTPSMRAEVFRQATFRHAAAPTIGAFPTPTGYVVEGLITAADLDLPSIALTMGPRVGFDLAVNVSNAISDAGACGNRRGQYFFHVDTSSVAGCGVYPFCDVRGFCLPVLTP